jgi:hypothetical protein
MVSFWLGILFCLVVLMVVAPLFCSHTWQIEDEPLNHIDVFAK